MKTKTLFMKDPGNRKPSYSGFFLGLTFALALTLAAFEWRTPSYFTPPLPGNQAEEMVFFEDPPIYVVKPAMEKVEKPKQKIQTTKITVEPISKGVEKNVSADPAEEPIVITGFAPVDFPEEPIPADRDLFTPVEQMPVFPGGEIALMKFLFSNVIYPKMSKEIGITGTVFVEFIVETDGAITNIKIAKGVSSDIDREALRVINEMPNWIPGSQRNKPVPVGMRLPIRFTLI